MESFCGKKVKSEVVFIKGQRHSDKIVLGFLSFPFSDQSQFDRQSTGKIVGFKVNTTVVQFTIGDTTNAISGKDVYKVRYV